MLKSTSDHRSHLMIRENHHGIFFMALTYDKEIPIPDGFTIGRWAEPYRQLGLHLTLYAIHCVWFYTGNLVKSICGCHTNGFYSTIRPISVNLDAKKRSTDSFWHIKIRNSPSGGRLCLMRQPLVYCSISIRVIHKRPITSRSVSARKRRGDLSLEPE